MQVSATTWNTLSKLLDEALDLDPAARDTWLEQLRVRSRSSRRRSQAPRSACEQ